MTRRLPRRLTQLYVGLLLYGLSLSMLIRAELGLDPWDVFHQGLAKHTGWSFGTVVIAVGVVVLLTWIPLRQIPGVGTVSNAIVVGLVVDAVLAIMPEAHNLALRIALLVGGIVLTGLATGLYIGARLGSGPRDGLMTGLVARWGWSIRVTRTAIEVTVLVAGWLLGGTVGIGTVAFALLIGPLVQVFLPRLTVPESVAPDGSPAPRVATI